MNQVRKDQVKRQDAKVRQDMTRHVLKATMTHVHTQLCAVVRLHVQLCYLTFSPNRHILHSEFFVK